METVLPTRYGGVWLAGGRLPISADPPLARLVKGVERVASIRAEIAHAAKVATMPGVEVVPYIWTSERVLICGRVTALRQSDGAYFGVQIPAPTALCTDHAAVRALLVHEFAHWFYLATRVVNGSEAGEKEGGILDLRNDGLTESDTQINVQDWFGDPITLAMARTRTFARRKVFLVSTPKITGMSRIESAYEESDQRKYWVPCPTCREFQILKFAQLRWPKGDPQSAVYVCEHCGQEIRNHQKHSMLARGGWRAGAKGDGRTAGFHISSLYSPVGWFSWGDAAKQFEQAQKNPALLQVFVNTVLGETWTLLGEAPEWQKLYDRRESYKIGTVPLAGCSLRLARMSRRTASRSRLPRGAGARSRGRSITGCSKGTRRDRRFGRS